MTISISDSDSQGDLGPARHRHLKRAPIREALIDFRVQLAEGVTVQGLEQMAVQLEGDYPTKGIIQTLQAQLDVAGPIIKPDLRHGKLGVLLKSPDEKTQVQFRLNGFTLNRLKPYTSWEEIYPETIRLWRLYVEFAKPTVVVRLAARYINQLELPLPVINLRNYFIAPPQVPESLPQTLRAYLTRVVIHEPSLEHSAIVTQSFEPNPTDKEHAAILLDIDAFKSVALKPVEHEEIDRVLNDLHRFKNDVFFGSITQRASKLFE